MNPYVEGKRHDVGVEQDAISSSIVSHLAIPAVHQSQNQPLKAGVEVFQISKKKKWLTGPTDSDFG